MIKTLEEHIDWFTFPVLFLMLHVFNLAWLEDGLLSWLALLAFGWGVWTLAEYVIHRWVLHGPYWMAIHQRHHEHPRELTRFPLYQIPGYFVVIWLLTWLVVGALWPPVFAGIVLGYLSFITMHAVMHHAPALVPGHAIAHNAHHKLTSMNYGISTVFWDRVFGTYRPARRY